MVGLAQNVDQAQSVLEEKGLFEQTDLLPVKLKYSRTLSLSNDSLGKSIGRNNIFVKSIAGLLQILIFVYNQI